MYNNFSSKKTKKVISALLASALVVTSAPITADAATTKVLGVKKTFTVKKTTKVSGLSKAEKKIVKVTVNKKKRKVTVKGVKPGKATFKIGSKKYNVKVGSTSVAVKAGKKTMTVGQYTNVKATGKNGAKDTIVFTSSNSKVVAVNSAKKATKTANSKGVASVKATAKKAGTVTITAASKYTGKKVKIKLTVKAATTPTATPEVTATATATGGAATATPEVTATATATATATTNPTATGNAATATPEVPSGSATTAPTEVPSGSATTAPTVDPSATAVPTVDPSATVAPTQTPEVVSASVVSVSAVNTQDEAISLDAVTKNGSIKVTFSEVVTESTVNNNTFKITDANGKNISLPVSAVTLNPGGKTVTVDLKDLGLDKGANYTLSISGVKTKNGDEVVANKTAFTVAKIAVLSYIKLDGASRDDELDTNMETATKQVITGYSAGTIIVKYDEYVDASTATAANITLVNTTTGEQVALTYDTNDGNGKIIMTPKTQLIGNNLYTLTIKGVKTAVNGATEDMVHTFTVNGDAPLTGTRSCRTIDAMGILENGTTEKIWPNVKPGLKSLSIDNSKYYAGLQLLVTVTEALDAQSVTENVMLVEKETKEIVDATITYDEVSRMISIVPNKDLDEEVEYQVRFLGGLKTKDNVYLDSSSKTEFYDHCYFGFKTMDASEPEVVSFVSKTATTAFEASKAQEFVVTFSESVELAGNHVKIALSSTDLEENGPDIANSDYNYTVTPVAGTDKKQYTIKINEGILATGKAYKIRLVGKDMANYAAVNKAKDVIVDGNTNFLAKSEVYTFSTTADKTAPSLVNVYFGDKSEELDAESIITGKKTNIESGDEFTFLFDEELATTDDGTSWGPNFATKYTNNIKLQVKQQGEWKDVLDANGNSIVDASGNPIDTARIAVNPVAVTNKDGKCVAMTINVTGTTTDSEYRIVFEKGSIVDRVRENNATGEKPNQMEEFRYEFIGTGMDDKAKDIKIFRSLDEKAADVSLSNPIEDNTTSSNAQKDVKIKSRFFMVFEEEDVTGVKTANVTLKDADGNVVAGKVEEITDSVAVGHLGATSTDASGVTTKTKATYVFVPEKDLAYSTTYVLTIDGVKDVIGNSIEKKEVSFKTKDADLAVTPSIADKATNVDMTPVIDLTFNAEVAKGTDFTVSLQKVKQDGTLGTNLIDAGTGAKAEVRGEKKSYSIVFDNADASEAKATNKLEANTTYQLVVTDVKAGKVLKKITFTTGYTRTDSVKPSVAKVYFGKDANIYSLIEDDITNVNFANGENLIIQYSEKVDTTDAQVEITNVTDKDSGVSVLNASKNTDGTTVTWKTIGINTGGTDVYKIVVSGVKDEAGNVCDTKTYFAKSNSSAQNDTDLENAAESAVAAYEAAYAAASGVANTMTDSNLSTKSSGLGYTAVTAIAKVKDTDKADTFKARVAVVDDIVNAGLAVKAAEAAVTTVNTDDKIKSAIDAYEAAMTAVGKVAADKVVRTTATTGLDARMAVVKTNLDTAAEISVSKSTLANIDGTVKATFKNGDATPVELSTALTGDYAITEYKWKVTVDGNALAADVLATWISSDGKSVSAPAGTAAGTYTVSLTVTQGSDVAITSTADITVTQ